MLRELSVRNLALIEDVRVELSEGFCAWTGETGAGKSLLLGALGLLLGERSSIDLIRAGTDELYVAGRFELVRPELRAAVEAILPQPLEEPELILSRRLHRSGRSQVHVNESPVSIGFLRQLGELLVDVHGQRESYSLLQPAYQLELLDAFGKLTDLRRQYQALAERVRALRRLHRELAEQQQQRQRELSLIRFEREELDAAKLHPDELVELTRERDRLIHAQSLRQFTALAADRLYDADGSIVEQLGRLLKEAETWSSLDSKIAEVTQRLETIVPEIEDLADTCRDLSERFDTDPERLEEIEKRLQLLRKLEAKYRKPLAELIAYRDTLDQQEARLQQQEESLSSLESQIAEVFAELRSVANKLSKQRAKVAKKLASETQKHLANLGMPNAKLETGLESIPLGDNSLLAEIPDAGIDRLELMLMANPGEPARPLRKVASGGEMSRTMLALKTVLAEHDPVGTLIFDEIDANVGGRLGDILGEKLALLGRSHQVICVTHLPQVACYAKHQWTIRKQTQGKRTSTTITPLCTEAERIEELAIMLRGDSRSESTRREAAEMLQAARAKW